MRKEPAVEPVAFGRRDAERYLGVGQDYLEYAAIPRCDIRKPGAKRARWVWLKADLDAFLESRRLLPGQPSPFGRE